MYIFIDIDDVCYSLKISSNDSYLLKEEETYQRQIIKMCEIKIKGLVFVKFLLREHNEYFVR